MAIHGTYWEVRKRCVALLVKRKRMCCCFLVLDSSKLMASASDCELPRREESVRSNMDMVVVDGGEWWLFGSESVE
ncbi:hypothetical protein TSUD_112630 [Trifolium subterraneum]|uniref:Uncharacterized protein n=1 Tax=Trifolium subterraneum TaxID=3900 RepID=A0A2Z6M1P2_TRISU|nr:hypothetical protein TSUD_112630 [Trifolium subterraneum]